VFCPTREVIYPEGFDTYVVPGRLASGLCGASRPTHFRGVATVVNIFFRLTRCDIAVFGEKDFQQLQIIRRLTRDLCLDVQIVGAPIVREADGLAMSSRNTYLSADERQQAVVLWRALEHAATLVADGQRRAATIRDGVVRTVTSAPLARVDYIDIVDPDTLQPLRTIEHQAVCALAVHFGSTRLIDNRRLTLAEPVTSS
jgi:pantoate--beta-alanine ligase